MKLSTVSMLKFAIILLISIIFYFALNIVLPLTSFWVMLLGIIISFIPVFVWGSLYKKLDIKQPEPFQMILLAFLVGMFTAKYLMLPIKHIATTFIWGTNIISITSDITLALFYGFVSVFLILFAMRIAITSSEFFDEPIDAIIYTSTIGLGFAFALNLDFIFAQTDLNVGVITSKVMLNSLAYSACASVLGIAIARAKFRGMSDWKFASYSFITSIILAGIFIFDNILNLYSPFGQEYQALGNLIIIAIIAFTITMYVFLSEQKIKSLISNKRLTISTKPSLFITILASLILGLIGAQMRVPEFKTINLDKKLSLKIPSSSYPTDLNKKVRKYTIIFDKDVYNLKIAKLPDSNLNDLVLQYKLRKLPLVPMGEPNLLDRNSSDSTESLKYTYYKVISSDINDEPILLIGIDSFVKGENGYWLIRIEGKNFKKELKLLNRIFNKK